MVLALLELRDVSGRIIASGVRGSSVGLVTEGGDVLGCPNKDNQTSSTFFCYVPNPSPRLFLRFVPPVGGGFPDMPDGELFGEIGGMPLFVSEGVIIGGAVGGFILIAVGFLFWGGRVYRIRMRRLRDRLLGNFNDFLVSTKLNAPVLETDVVIDFNNIEVARSCFWPADVLDTV